MIAPRVGNRSPAHFGTALRQPGGGVSVNIGELTSILFVMATIGYMARLISEVNAVLRPERPDPDG